jgi:type IV secretory pathway TraG/TraD family ATPase VirD4
MTDEPDNVVPFPTTKPPAVRKTDVAGTDWDGQQEITFTHDASSSAPLEAQTQEQRDEFMDYLELTSPTAKEPAAPTIMLEEPDEASASHEEVPPADVEDIMMPMAQTPAPAEPVVKTEPKASETAVSHEIEKIEAAPAHITAKIEALEKQMYAPASAPSIEAEAPKTFDVRESLYDFAKKQARGFVTRLHNRLFGTKMLTYAGDAGGMMVLAGPRAGKSGSIVIPTALTWGMNGKNQSLVVLDLKGEIAAVTGPARSRIINEKGEPHEVLMFDTRTRETDCVNALSILDPKSERFALDVLAVSSWLVPDSGPNTFFRDAPRMLIAWAICELFDDTREELITDRTMRGMMRICSLPAAADEPKEDFKTRQMREAENLKNGRPQEFGAPKKPDNVRDRLKATIERCRKAQEAGKPEPLFGVGGLLAGGFASASAETFANVHTSVGAALNWLMAPNLARLVSGPLPGEPGRVVPIDTLTKGNKTAYICCTETDLEASPGFARVLIGGLMRSFTRTVGLKPRCLFLLDEFPRLGKFPEAKAAADLMGGFGLTVMVICQDLGQIEKNYGREGKQGWLEGSVIKLVTAVNDTETAEWVSKALGKKTEIQMRGNGQGLSAQDHSSPLMTVADILDWPQGYGILMSRTGYIKKPWWKLKRDYTRNARVKLAFYKDMPELAALAEKNPYDAK